MTRNSTILIAILVILIGAYWFFFTGKSQELPLTASAPADPAEQRFIDLAGKLNSISFDADFFNDPRFLSLQSLATPILPEVQGRLDPFAPIGH